MNKIENLSQPGILDDIPQHARYLEFNVKEPDKARNALESVAGFIIDDTIVIGISSTVIDAIHSGISGLTAFPEFGTAASLAPSTQVDIWVWIRGNNPGNVFHRSLEILGFLEPYCNLVRQVDGFKYDIGRDLTGYEDGTENPVGDAAITAALVNGSGPGLDGASFVAVQHWRHDFPVFNAMSLEEQDNIIGRHRDSNEEFDAPEFAHVKRTAQESFDPEAFLVRRSLPWSNSEGSGLVFVAFASSFYAFDVQMRRMLGLEDGVLDGLFQFSRPVTGSYFWCPPVKGSGYLDFSALNLI